VYASGRLGARARFKSIAALGTPKLRPVEKYYKMAARDEGTMTTAIDTNVVIALWDKDSALSLAAQNALEAAFDRGTLVAAAPVFAELIAAPGRSEAFVGCLF
jgi:hypothetical protein